MTAPVTTGWRPTFITDLRAYHNDPEIKAKYLARVHAHRLADELQRGFYWEDGKGCAVGCTIHDSSHASYETELGIPRILARLEDRLFEGMANDAAQLWPERFLDAIPIGADLSLIWPRFAVWLLGDENSGVIRHATTPETRESIRRVVSLYERLIGGDAPERKEWTEARDYAWNRWYVDAAAADADAAAADADAAAADADAAAAAADAAAAAADAADADAAAADADAADDAAWRRRYTEVRTESYGRMAEKLIELLAQAPIPTVGEVSR